MPDNDNGEVVVVVPEDVLNPAANPADSFTPTESEPMVVEIFDAIFDPTGSNDPTDPTAIATGAGEPEVVVIEPGADTPVTGDGLNSAPIGDAGIEGGVESFAVSPDTEAGTLTPNATDLEDSPVTATGLDDPTSGVLGSALDVTSADTGTTTTDSTTDTTDPDTQSQADALSDSQQTLQQAEQNEAQAAASGDYATAQDDAQQAYSASQDVANAGGPDNTDETWQAAQNESWANWDQETANEDAQSAESYTAAGFTDDAQMYAADAQNEQATADDYGEAGEYGDSLGPQEDCSTIADEAPVDGSGAADTSTVDEDSSATGD